MGRVNGTLRKTLAYFWVCILIAPPLSVSSLLRFAAWTFLAAVGASLLAHI